jgi:hypothetical protein
MVKQASIQEDFPVNNKDSCLASALRIELAKSEWTPVDLSDMEKVAAAVEAYGLKDVVNDLSSQLKKGSLEKAASAGESSSGFQKAAEVNMEMTGDSGYLEKVASAAVMAWDAYQQEGIDTTPEHVARYSGHLPLSKSAALSALQSRYAITQSVGFAKIAQALGSQPEMVSDPNVVASLCRVVSGMDKLAKLDIKGFNFYREALITKSAAMSTRIKIGKEEFPAETVMKVPVNHLNSYLGADIGKEISSGDPMTVKAVVESLPADLQQVLLRVMKSTVVRS